jgi:hypothetical protein
MSQTRAVDYIVIGAGSAGCVMAAAWARVPGLSWTRRRAFTASKDYASQTP